MSGPRTPRAWWRWTCPKTNPSLTGRAWKTPRDLQALQTAPVDVASLGLREGLRVRRQAEPLPLPRLQAGARRAGSRAVKRVTASAIVAPDPRAPGARQDVLTTAVIDGRIWRRWDHDGEWVDITPVSKPAVKPAGTAVKPPPRRRR